MQFLSDGTVAATPPVPPAMGDEGYPTNGTPGVVAPTRITDWWLCLVQMHARGEAIIAGLEVSPTGYAEGAERAARIAAAKAGAVASTRALTLADQGLLLADASGGSMTLTLPAASVAAGLTLPDGSVLPTIGPRFTLHRADTSGNSVTLEAAGGDLVGDASSLTLLAGETVTVQSDGNAGWHVLGRYTPPASASARGDTVSATFTPSSGSTNTRSLSFTAPADGFIDVSATLNFGAAQPVSITNALTVNGSSVGGDISTLPIHNRVLVPVVAGDSYTLTQSVVAGTSGGAFQSTSMWLSYAFIPAV